MSFQSTWTAARLVRSRTLYVGCGTVLSSLRGRPFDRKLQRQWVSTSRSDNTRSETIGKLSENVIAKKEASEKDTMMQEIQKVTQRNIQRILREQPQVKKRWERITRKRQLKERKRDPGASAARSNTATGSSASAVLRDTKLTPSFDSAHVPPDSNYQLGEDLAHLSVRNLDTCDFASEATVGDIGRPLTDRMSISVENVSTQLGGSDLDTPRDNEQASTRDTNLVSKGESTGATSLLDMLRQPIEDESFVKRVAHEKSVHSDLQPTMIQPASLLDLLNDDSSDEAAHHSTIDVWGEAKSVSTKEDDPGEAAVLANDSRPSLLDVLREPIEDEILSNTGENSHEEFIDTRHRSEGLMFDSTSAVSRKSMESTFVFSGDGTAKADQTEDGYIEGEKSSTLSDNLSVEKVCTLTQSFSDTLASATQCTSWQVDSFDKLDLQRQSSSRALNDGLALILAMKDTDWSKFNAAIDSIGHDYRQKDYEEIEELVDCGDKANEIVEEILEYDSESDDGRINDIADEIAGCSEMEVLLERIRGVLDEASSGDIILTTGDYNMVLLCLSTSVSFITDDAIKMMIKTYHQMVELGKAGEGSCAPDANTYTILIAVMNRRAQAPLSAADICRDMIDSNAELSAEALVQGMRCFQRHNNVQDAERLLNTVLEREVHEAPIPAEAFIGLLEIYKSLNLQGDATDLVGKCIQVCQAFSCRINMSPMTYLLDFQ